MRSIRPIGDGICEVPLTQGKVALIDECDAERVGFCGWWASSNRQTTYAMGRAIPKKREVHLHRFLLGFPQASIDHINGDGLDNRRCNLRQCTVEQNNRNRTCVLATSGFKGVSRCKTRRERWEAEIRVCGKGIYLGAFATKQEAAAAYDVASLAVHGEFGFQNGIEATPEIISRVMQQIREKLPEFETKPLIGNCGLVVPA